MTDPHCVERMQRAPDALRTYRLAGVWHARQAGGAGAREGLGELLGRVADLGPTQPQRDHVIAHPVDRPVGHQQAIFGADIARDVDHQPDRHA